MALNDVKYSALVASGFSPTTLNDMEYRFWALMSQTNGGPFSPTPTYTAVTADNYKASSAAPTTSGTLTTTSAQVQLVNATSGAVTLTLPTAASANKLYFFIKKTDGSANTVTIQGNGAELIDGANTKVISTQYTSIEIYSNGTAWFILSNN